MARVSGLLRAIGSLAILAIVIIIGAATCWASIGPKQIQRDGPEASVVEVDLNDPQHRAILDALARAWLAADRPVDQLDLLIVQASELNAASYGSGAFLFWSGVGSLPSWAIEAIAAHEVSHDILLHSRRTSDLAALLDFFAELIGILSGADFETEAAMRGWLHTLALPSYSRAQELEADQRAKELLARMGYSDPGQVFARTLQILLDRYGESGGGFFSSHPATSERISQAVRDR